MTETPAVEGHSHWPLAGWLLLVLVAAGAAGLVFGGVLSPVVVLDVISLWPLAVPVVPLALWVYLRTHGRTRAVPALYLVSFLVLAVGVHLSEFPPLPSGEADVSGPATLPAEVERASLALTLDAGTLSVESGDQAVYRVRPSRNGGDLGVPRVFERPAGGTLQLVAEPRAATEWFRFGGWRVELTPAIRWSLTLKAPRMQLDLSQLQVESVSLAGDGEVTLGTPGQSTIELSGDLTVTLPTGSRGTVIGDAAVPAGWIRTTNGEAVSPVGADGWQIVVGEGSDVVIQERSPTP